MLYPILTCKCPKCEKGNIFPSQNPYQWGAITDTNRNCPHCGILFEKEIGFYWGAMYVSYALAIAVSVAVATVFLTLFGWHTWYLFVTIILSLTAVSPLLFRYSRTIWLYLNSNN